MTDRQTKRDNSPSGRDTRTRVNRGSGNAKTIGESGCIYIRDDESNILKHCANKTVLKFQMFSFRHNTTENE